MCKDKEDVIYYMEENEIGTNSALFYAQICKISESKMDYSQADKYILEAKYKQAQPQSEITELIKQFEQRMEQRVRKLKDIASVQMYHDNKQSDSKKRTRRDFQMSSSSSNNINNNNNYATLQVQSNQNVYKAFHTNKYPYNHNGKKEQSTSIFSLNAKKQQKKKLPDKVYIGDGINIFVDEEFRQDVFPNSTIQVNEYLNTVDEIKEYLESKGEGDSPHWQSYSQQKVNLSQKSFLPQQTLLSSTELAAKNRFQLHQALHEDMFFPKQSIFDIDLQISWIGREEKKYKSFELIESQKNSQQIVQFNICDILMQGSSPPSTGFYLNSSYEDKNKKVNPQTTNQYPQTFQQQLPSINNKQFPQINQQFQAQINQEQPTYQIKHQQPSLTPVRSSNQIGIVECDSLYASQSPFKYSDKQNYYQNGYNQQRNQRQQNKFQMQQEHSPLRLSHRRASQNNQNSEDSINYYSSGANQSQSQCKQSSFEKGNVTPQKIIGYSPFEGKQKSNVKQQTQNSRYSLTQSKGRLSSNLMQQNNQYENVNDQKQQKQTQNISPLSPKKHANKEESINILYFDDIKRYNNHYNIFQQQSQQQQKSFNQSHLKNIKQFEDSQDFDSLENSNLNKAFNDVSKDSDNEDESGSLDFYSDHLSFLQKRSKSSKLSHCIRTRKSTKFDKIDIFGNGNMMTSSSDDLDSPQKDIKQFSSNRKSINRRSVEKLRNIHQPNPNILNMPNLNNQSFQSVLFSQEFSQVNNIFPQEGFFSPSSLDENFFKIHPAPISNTKGRDRKKQSIKCSGGHKNGKEIGSDQEDENDDKDDDERSDKSLTEKEDEEINDMLDQYCFGNEHKYANDPDYHHDQNINFDNQLFNHQVSDKENQNLIINQRNSKSQSRLPRKALQQLPIEEFTDEAAALDNPILPLSLSINHNEAFLTTQFDNNDNLIFYSNNQFRNSRHAHQPHTDDHSNLLLNQNIPYSNDNHNNHNNNKNINNHNNSNNNRYEFILTKSMCDDDNIFNHQNCQIYHNSNSSE